MGTAVGQWLEEALLDLCGKPETGLNFDRDVISGLVSYCDLAQPVDAKEYLDVISLSFNACGLFRFRRFDLIDSELISDFVDIRVFSFVRV